MQVFEILDRLSELGVNVEVVDGRIDYWPAGRVPAALRDEMRQHKPELLAVLTSRWCWVCGAPSQAETDGRQHCQRHEPSTATVRALWEAAELYERLGREWDALTDSGETVPQSLSASYFAAADAVRAANAPTQQPTEAKANG